MARVAEKAAAASESTGSETETSFTAKGKGKKAQVFVNIKCILSGRTAHHKHVL